MDEVPGEFLGEEETEGCYAGKERGVKAGFDFVFTLMKWKGKF